MSCANLSNVFSKILRYPTQETYDYADNLLPLELKGKTKNQIKEYLTGESTEQNDLRLKLNNFGFTTRKSRNYWDKGLTFGYYNVPWDVENNDYKQINQQNMMLLNLLLFTNNSKSKCNNFVYSVLIAIDLTNQLPFRKQMNSEGRFYCVPINLKGYWIPEYIKGTVPGRYYFPYY